MKQRSRLSDKVVVITGASSGIGRATAIELARRGARVVVSARRQRELEETARACVEAGGYCLVVVADVTRAADVEALVRRTLDQFGRIDVWVNNAGVTLFGLLEQAPFEEHQRVIETNLFGAMHAARAVIPVFRRQRRGVMINVGSILSNLGQPFVPSYVISKFGLKGMTEVLRAELADFPEVHVCTIFPYATDTQHFQTGANHVGLAAHAMAPMIAAERVAVAIADLAERPRRERYVPRVMALGVALRHLFPRTAEGLIVDTLRSWHFDAREQQRGSGNLFAPLPEPGRVDGDRPPLIGSARLALWVLGRLGKRQLAAMRRAPRRLLQRAEAAI